MRITSFKSKQGFTLIELLVVLVIMTLLASLVGPKLFNKLGSSKVKVAKNQIELLVSALDTYRLDIGHYPTKEQGLQALQTAPANTLNWEGPYLDKIPLDPWDQAYHYQVPGQNQGFALFSYGADMQPGGNGTNADWGYF